MIVVVEPQMQGNKHVQINSSMLKILCREYNEDIKVYCDTYHKESVEVFLTSHEREKIQFSTFTFNEDAELKKIAIIQKVIREINLFIKVFKENKNPRFLIFTSMFPFSGVCFNLISKFSNSKKIICLHGEIGVLSKKGFKLTTYIYKIIISFFLLSLNKKTILLFYGKTIEENLRKKIKRIRRINTISIDHPYNYNYKIDDKKAVEKITIANIGTGLISKNSQYIYKLATLQKDNILCGKIELIQVGNVSSQVKEFSNDLVKNVCDSGFMPFDVYESYLKDADFFIYFFKDNSYYDLCPSGTFFDAIRYKKPILSLRNSFFQYYFDKFGDIGYLADSVSELNTIVNNILENNCDYEEMIGNLEKAEIQLSLDKIGHNFSQQINNILDEYQY